MLLDKQNLFSDAQAITVTAVSTDKVDLNGTASTTGFTTDTLGNTPVNDPGRSPELDVLFTVTEAFTAVGAATLTIALVTDEDPTLATPTTLVSTAAIGKALLVPGYQARLSLPAGNAAADRYLGASYTVATGPMTAGKITAGLIARDGRQTAPGSFT